MSDALALVRFPDGAIRWARYQGSSDSIVTALYDTLDEAWDSTCDYPGPGPHEDEPVEIYSHYGGGSWWPGRATRDHVTVGAHPLGIEGQGGAVIEPRAEEWHDEVPAWAAAVLDAEGLR